MDWDILAEHYLAVGHQVMTDLREPIEAVAKDLAERIRAGRKIMICGNGGSAADAQHFAAELTNRFLKERRPYAGLALTTDTSALTAIANDYGYEYVFAKQVEALGQSGDALVAISTSGCAKNVCSAVESAKAMDIHTIALTGGQGGDLVALVDTVLSVAATDSTPRIQEGHGLIIHLLCERIEELLA